VADVCGGEPPGDIAAIRNPRKVGGVSGERQPRKSALGFLEVRLREYAEGASSSPVGFLEGWYVVEEVRKQGVGRKLVEAGEQWARSMGCTEMGSNTEIWRTGSMEAHLSLGYTEVERDVNFLKKLK
jgi:aminoglycoside 6'-N-acetyltransferase I